MIGYVKMYNSSKGYGFIHTEENADIFFHFSAIICDGHQSAKVGEKFEFDVEETPKGSIAVNMKKIS